MRTFKDITPNKQQVIYKYKNIYVNKKYKYINQKVRMFINTFKLTYGKNIYTQLFFHLHSLYS